MHFVSRGGGGEGLEDIRSRTAAPNMGRVVHGLTGDISHSDRVLTVLALQGGGWRRTNAAPNRSRV